MQKNFQQHEQFVTELGSLLAAQTNQRQSLQQRQAMTNLAEYIGAARRHHKLSRATLARKTGKSEVEIFALEQGIYPYTQIDSVFLCQLATALGEEVETLMLLLGRTAFPIPAAVQTSVHEASVRGCITQHKTRTYHFDNRIVTWQWANFLHENCLNLIDFVRAGRLSSYTRTLYTMGTRVTYRVGIAGAMLACLLFLWVSTYSLSDGFDAQSTIQSYATQSWPIHAQQTSVSTSISSMVSPASPTEAIHFLPRRQTGQPATIALDPTEDGQITVTSSFALPISEETQQCITPVVDRFALCPV